jgi:hypothetical protein
MSINFSVSVSALQSAFTCFVLVPFHITPTRLLHVWVGIGKGTRNLKDRLGVVKTDVFSKLSYLCLFHLLVLETKETMMFVYAGFSPSQTQ